MKITQTPEEMTITDSGKSTLLGGVLFILFGIGLLLFLVFRGFLELGKPGQQAPWALIAFSVGAIAIGAWILLTAEKKVIRLSKKGQSGEHRERLIGNKSSDDGFNLADIAFVQHTKGVEQRTNTQRNTPEMWLTGTVTLVFRDNKTITVGEKSKEAQGTLGIGPLSMDLSGQDGPLLQEAQQIASFIGVELKTEDGSDLSILNKITQFATGENANATTASNQSQPSLAQAQQPLPEPTPQPQIPDLPGQ